MRKWEYESTSFINVRNLLDVDFVTVSTCFSILKALEVCCDELTPDNRTEWYFYEDFKDMKSRIREEIEYMDDEDYESWVQTVYCCLDEFYDLCDVANVWLPL